MPTEDTAASSATTASDTGSSRGVGDVADRIALVTGANKGIGFEIARELARRCMTVYVGARDSGRGSAAAGAVKH